jgi:uncharacterized cupin superfamily protein
MFSYAQLPEIVKHNVRGGVGELRCRDYLKAVPGDLSFDSFGLNEMQPGATIPEHCHADNAEFYFIVSGHGIGLHNGRSFPVGPGDAWTCQMGETHGILNTEVPGQVLSFVSVFFAPQGPK